MALVPASTNDLITLIINLLLIVFAFFLVDFIFSRGKTTASYWLRLFGVGLILIFIPPLVDGLFQQIDELFNNAINTSGISPIVAFVIGIYSVRYITIKQGTGEQRRTWENSIWLTFFGFLIILIITSFIDWLAAHT